MSKYHLSSAHWQFLRANVRAILTGKLASKHGNTPQAPHAVPANFSGVSVATASNPEVDAYIIQSLKNLGIAQVRLDFTYGDEQNHVARFLKQLIAASFQVHLHLVQPHSAASNMQNSAEQAKWREFVSFVCEQYGKQIALIEVGSTINRVRWAGYTLNHFLIAWQIAHQEIKQRGITLAGPNVTDFEPFYNIGILSILKARGQLPDIHTNNLFSERCTEPERDDHKILGRTLAKLAGYRLVKKAFVLKNIGQDYGVANMHSPSAFWTLPRIERLLPDGEQKQADYLARYMLLCAASGALEHAAWGPLICHREGLIDEDITQYPKLERITHYASVSKNASSFRTRPAFNAYKTFASLIPNSQYLGQLNQLDHLQVHAFNTQSHQIHALWTTNGKAALLSDIYSHTSLENAQAIDRDGQTLNTLPHFITESPIYLLFDAKHHDIKQAIAIKAQAAVKAALAIHAHSAKLTHYSYQQGAWSGVILAHNDNQAKLLTEALKPELLEARPSQALLRNARNAIWTIADPRDSSKKLVVKQPVKMHAHKKWLDQYKPSKALRSWNGASELLRRGIANAQPIAYIELANDRSLMQNYYICEYVAASCSVREAFSAFANGQNNYQDLTPENLYPALCDYLYTMHSHGVFFRDLSGGNILIIKEGVNISFSLIDTARAHFFNHGTSLPKRLSDLARACNKLHAEGRDTFMSMYMQKMGKEFGFWQKLPFYIYNTKVKLKRYSKRKNWLKIFKK